MRLEGSEQVLAALGSADPIMRQSVLRALAVNPQAARGYAGLENALVKLLASCQMESERLLLLAALSAFDQGELLWLEFCQSQQLEILMLLASRLKQEPWIVNRLGAALESTSGPRQVVMASMLVGVQGLPPPLEVRVACLATLEARTPPLDSSLWPVWCELLGLQKTRALLQTHSEGAATVKRHWNGLDQEQKQWALDWLFPDPEIIERCLACPNMRMAALARMAGGNWGSQVAHLWESNPALRPALVRAGLEVDLEAHPELREDMVDRLGPEADWESLLCGPWRLRSAALQRLVQLGVDDSQLRSWAGSEVEELRLAAAWLEQAQDETVSD